MRRLIGGVMVAVTLAVCSVRAAEEPPPPNPDVLYPWCQGWFSDWDPFCWFLSAHPTDRQNSATESPR